MKSPGSPLFLRGSCALMIGLLAMACVSKPPALQTLTYPPDFSYVPRERLQSTMWILAAEVTRLDGLLRDADAPNDPRLKDEVRQSLRRMAASLEQIDYPGHMTQYPELNQHLARFEERVHQALRDVERTPPRFFLASTLSGSCFLCHVSGDEGQGQ